MSGPSLTFHERLTLLLADYEDGESVFHLQLASSQMIDLASGYVPADVRAMCLAALDWREDDRRRAARPVQRKGRAS
jgi:hypothetical protein